VTAGAWIVSATRDRKDDWTGRFDGHLEVQPPLGDEQLAQIPARRGVMALLGPGGQTVLLTTAADIRSRLAHRLRERPDDERRKTADLREVTRQILWKLATSHFEADLYFLELAEAIMPRRYPSLLAWGGAWFVRVDPAAEVPHFVRTRAVLGAAGVHVGPFAGARQADRFIDALQDAFDLCRDVRCLRQAPHGQRCTYAQMGRCRSPCDGSISMEEYRQMVSRAAEFACGRRGARRRELAGRMRAAAKRLAFEEAAGLKKRLARLAELDSPAWRHVAPLAEFRFVLVQRGGRSRQVKVFLADLGRIVQAKPLSYPLRKRQLDGVLRAMRGHLSNPAPHEAAERWRLALVAHYLYAGEARSGLILRWREGLDAEALAEAIESSAERLGLKRPPSRA